MQESKDAPRGASTAGKETDRAKPCVPLRSSDRRSSSACILTDAGGSSRGVPLTFRDLCVCTYRVIGSRSRPGLALRRPSRSSGHTLPPGKSRLQLRSLLALRPLQSFTRAGRWLSREASPSLGVRSPSALAIAAAYGSRVYLARFVAPSGFVSPPGALLLPRSPRPYFMPRTLGVRPSKLFPSRGGGVPLGAPLPTCRRLERHPASAACLARLLGLAPLGSPSRERREVPPPGPMLPWASPSPGVSSRSRRPRLPADLLPRASRRRRIPHRLLGVSIVAGPVRLRGDHRPS